MEKIWLKRYPPGVPAEIDPGRFGSLNDLLDWAAGRFPDAAAFSNRGTTLSWARLALLADRFGAYLRGIGMLEGERIAIMLPNLLQYPVAMFGAFRAGCVVVNVNPLYTARELRHQLADSGASAIVVLDNFAHTLETVLGETAVRHVITTGVGDLLDFPESAIVNLVVRHVRHMVPAWHIGSAVPFKDALGHGRVAAPPRPATAPADTAFLQYTGGTTGVPKAAVLSHRNILANVEQTAAWVRGMLVEGQETAVVPLPLYHVFALTVMLAFCRLGAHIVLITNPRDLPALVKELRRTRFSALIGVNTLFAALLKAEGIGAIDTRALKVVVAGGMAVQRAVAQRWQAQFGVPIVEGYGLTETSPIVCANRLDIPEYTGTVGLPLPSTEVALLDDDGKELAPGQVGEIGVRGPQVMRGYWNMPEETAHVFTAEGWLRTGDMGCMLDDGSVKVVDRKKDMIVVSGFKVFPNEVEDVVAMHPGVDEVAAIAVPAEHSHEAVKVVVVRRDPSLSAEALIEHCRRNLAAYKVPTQVRFSTEPLPKSNIGKILRRQVLADEARLAGGSAAAAAPARASGSPVGDV
jgi:long-chain acyl-CoA synthetase